MEDILASIREILSEDEKAVPAPTPLDLTEAMLVAPPAHPPLQQAAPPPEPDPAPVMVDVPAAEPAPSLSLHSLLAPGAAAAPAAALGELARAVAGERGAPISRGGASIEDVVREEIRPLLKAWLDLHLPPMVEQLVKAEIARVMGRGNG
jgi:cell pole-organizing protein PopZ